MSSENAKPTARVDAIVSQLREIFDVLDDVLGDTDPFLRDNMQDADIKSEEPVFWCARKVNEVIQSMTG